MSFVSCFRGICRTLDVFFGGVFREKDAKPIKLVSETEINDADIIIPLDKIYHVTGVVTALSDGHAVNSGDVTLLDADGVKFAEVKLEPDGSFYFPFVPKGEYNLSTAYGSDIIFLNLWSWKNPPLQIYEDSTQSLIVDHDLTDVVVQLQPKPSQ